MSFWTTESRQTSSICVMRKEHFHERRRQPGEEGTL